MMTSKITLHIARFAIGLWFTFEKFWIGHLASPPQRVPTERRGYSGPSSGKESRQEEMKMEVKRNNETKSIDLQRMK
ncbi:MAG: hypothetical protein A2156_12715 [Deltaproteobacteria bacterium RBG_16_48_10]|nr:MAG: hypothetical protein A2156_12715 [Deltaproteobacteria bacterium RBG_16_48_10]